MYGKKAVYFNYKNYGSFVLFMFVPALIVLAGLSMAASYFLAWQPALIGIALGVMLAFPGYPRLLAINANRELKSNKYKKALKKTGRAVKMPFAPVSVWIFHAYLLLLNNKTSISGEILKKVKDKKMSYSEKAKWEAVQALLTWVESGDAVLGMKYIDEKAGEYSDEAISYAKGKLLNSMDDKAAARNHNESAYEMYGGNRDILSNLVISYCRTGQTRDAKLLFRTLYNDLGATVDSLYFMAKVKETESKYKDGAEFIEAALEIESASTDLASKDTLIEYRDKLEEM